MITGRVSWLLEARVNIEVQDTEGEFHQFACILDTGYDGDVALPPRAIRQLGLASSDSRRVTLGNGESVTMAAYEAAVSWHGELVDVVVLQTERESYIGMALLENSTLTLQVWDGGNVLIEERTQL